MPGPFPADDVIDTGHPGYAAFQASHAKTQAFQNARTVEDWIRALDQYGTSSGEQRLLASVRANPDKYEVHSGRLREKPGFLAKNWPYLAVGGAIAAPYVAGAVGIGGGGSATTGGINAGVGSLGPAGLPGGALYGAAAPGVAGAPGAGVALGAAAKGFGGKVLDWLKDPQNILGLAGAVPLAMQAFGGGVGGGSGSSPTEDALLDEIRTNLGLQRARFQAAQPAFETAQRMAIGMAPTQYRAGGTA